jgi:hypothetical protein
VVTPGWFDWLGLVVSVISATVPAVIAIALWQNERRERTKDLRASAGLLFTAKLERLDEVGLVFARAKYLSEYAVVMGAGAQPLISLIDTTLEWAHDGDFDKEVDVAVDISDLIRKWTFFREYRADLIEVLLANGRVALAEEDNLLVSPVSRARAERELLRSREYWEWVRQTRLSPWRLRLRRIFRRARDSRRSWPLILNAFATRDWLMNGESVEDDSWLRQHTHLP